MLTSTFLATLSQRIHVNTGLSLMSPISRLRALVFWFEFPRIRPGDNDLNAFGLLEGRKNIDGEEEVMREEKSVT